MKIVTDSVFLIVSKCEKLIAKGTPRNRYIHHINEVNNKRFLTYSSEGRAKSGFNNDGFYLSNDTINYIKETYPQLVNKYGSVRWENIKQLFEAREFKCTYETTLKQRGD